MILGFHLTWTTYGHWFPNDPRGSWSDEVWKPELAAIRPLDDSRKVTRPRPAPQSELQKFVSQARAQLRWPPVELKQVEFPVIAAAFAETRAAARVEIVACAILPNHVHVVINRPDDSYERIVNRLKGRSSQRLREARRYPTAILRGERPPIWTQGYWVRYIDHPEQMECVMKYVWNNPIREGLPPQNWDFVQA